MRVPFVCGNWKMFKTVGEALGLVDSIRATADAIEGVEVGIAPPFTALHPASHRLVGSKVRLAAQNAHFERQGAFTGEVSVAMLADVGCRYVIVGHSERRQLFGESDELVGRKVGAVLRGGLRAILCLGETLSERESNRTLEVISRQLTAGIKELPDGAALDLVIAYEPVWAIGTGKVATPAQAQEAHAHLRSELGRLLGDEAAQTIRIQYGGSVKPENAKELFGQRDVDGGLIGGASLDAASFLAIARAAARAE
ncbi:MAG: triose-phosphate isomerase [Deltaproteobacteria bacterium]|nr:triose-phosphate isomerase [Deltaproteobacteria bacterium]